MLRASTDAMLGLPFWLGKKLLHAARHVESARLAAVRSAAATRAGVECTMALLRPWCKCQELAARRRPQVRSACN